jgi:hypothetical protein
MTKNTNTIHLDNRGLLSISGVDKKSFLQAIITNDIEGLAQSSPLYAAILTPQGKYLFDFILSENADGSIIYMDCELERIDQLLRRLTMYKLRADVEIKNISQDYNIWAVLGANLGFRDPRHAKLGNRLILPENEKPNLDIAPIDEYETLRLSLSIPNASKDIEVDKRPILEANFEALNGVSFTKGCYVGQEVTARMHYRNAVRKRIYGISFFEAAPDHGTIIYADDKKAGQVLSSKGRVALALIKDEYVGVEHNLTADGKTVELRDKNN